MERSESRHRQHSSHTKTKNQLQLPKINRTTVMIGRHKNSYNNKQNSFVATKSYESRLLLSYIDKVKWVVEEVDYSQWTDKEIDCEYVKLRKQLQDINFQVAKAVEKLNVKSLKKHKVSEPDSMKTLQLRGREVDNNNAIIQRLAKQYQNLQKRVSNISPSTKDNIETEIEESKRKIVQLRSKIKDLKLKNKSVGESLVNTDQFYDEIKKLEMEKDAIERKKWKLNTKSDKVLEQIFTSELKIQQISDDFTIAENYFEEYHGKEQVAGEQKNLERQYATTKHCLDVNLKKNQSLNNTKQQKYHTLLKSLETQMGKISHTQKRTSQVELQIIHKKKIIIELEELLRHKQEQQEQKLIKETAFFTEFEDYENKDCQGTLGNDKNGNKIEQSYEKIEEEDIAENQEEPHLENTNNFRVSTNQAEIEEEEKDVMMDLGNSDLDEKFKYGRNSKNRFNKSDRNRGNHFDIETEMDDSQDVIEGIDDDGDQQIAEFKTKISQQKWNPKNFALDLDLKQVEQNLRSIKQNKNRQDNEESIDDDA